MQTYKDVVATYKEKNSKTPKTTWRYESWGDSYEQGGRVGYKPGGIVEPGVTHYAKTELTVLKEKLAGITKSRNTMDQVSGLLDEV